MTKLVPRLAPREECVDVPKEICTRSVHIQASFMLLNWENIAATFLGIIKMTEKIFFSFKKHPDFLLKSEDF